MTPRSRPEGRPRTAAADESTTPEALTERGWTVIASLTGIEFAGGYRGHHLALTPWQGGWQWSVTHPTMCPAPRGRSGWTATAEEAEQRMRVAVDGFGCARRVAA